MKRETRKGLGRDFLPESRQNLRASRATNTIQNYEEVARLCIGMQGARQECKNLAMRSLRAMVIWDQSHGGGPGACAVNLLYIASSSLLLRCYGEACHRGCTFAHISNAPPV